MLISVVFLFPLSLKHTLSFYLNWARIKSVNWSGICCSPICCGRRPYSKTDTSSFTKEHTHTLTCTVRWCSLTLWGGMAETQMAWIASGVLLPCHCGPLHVGQRRLQARFTSPTILLTVPQIYFSPPPAFLIQSLWSVAFFPSTYSLNRNNSWNQIFQICGFIRIRTPTQSYFKYFWNHVFCSFLKAYSKTEVSTYSIFFFILFFEPLLGLSIMASNLCCNII